MEQAGTSGAKPTKLTRNKDMNVTFMTETKLDTEILDIRRYDILGCDPDIDPASPFTTKIIQPHKGYM